MTDFDVIVVGAGGAGLAAATTAASAGARVLLVEAGPRTGGSTALAGGVFYAAGTSVQREAGIADDSADAMYHYYMTLNQYKLEAALVRRLCDDAAPALEWLRGLGVTFKVEGLYASGVDKMRRGHRAAGGGAEIAEVLEGSFSGTSVDVALATRVESLLIEDGGVAGIIVDGEPVRSGAVVLATGGFGANPAMLADLYPDAAIHGDLHWYIGADTCRGDGITLGCAAGGEVSPANRGLLLLTPGFARDLESYLPGWLVMVNRHGRRFVDETIEYSVLSVVLREQPERECFGIFDEATRLAAKTSAYRPAPNWTSDRLGQLADAGVLARADSLDALAGELGIPAATLRTTVETHNRNVAAGAGSRLLQAARDAAPDRRAAVLRGAHPRRRSSAGPAPASGSTPRRACSTRPIGRSAGSSPPARRPVGCSANATPPAAPRSPTRSCSVASPGATRPGWREQRDGRGARDLRLHRHRRGFGRLRGRRAAQRDRASTACCCSRPGPRTRASGSTCRWAIRCCSPTRSVNWMFESEPEPELERPPHVPAARQGAGRHQLDQRHGLHARPCRATTTTGASAAAPAGATTTCCPISARRRTSSAASDEFHGVGGPLTVSDQPSRSRDRRRDRGGGGRGGHAAQSRLQRRARRKAPASSRRRRATSGAGARRRPICARRGTATNLKVVDRRPRHARADRGRPRGRRRVSHHGGLQTALRAARGDRVRRRVRLAAAAAAVGHRPGRASARHRHAGGARPAGRRREPAGPFLLLGDVPLQQGRSR